MTPAVAFRTDASLQIGSGHFLRCLSLATALRERGADCRFICREHPGHRIDIARERGFSVATLPGTADKDALDLPWKQLPAHAAWLGCDWRTDADQTVAALDQQVTDWLVVDHYALDGAWEAQLQRSCRQLMVIDDLADRPHHCDLLLDQNLGRQRSDYASLVSKNCSVLAGPAYALLRPEFAAQRAESLHRRSFSLPRHLLITMGGGDQRNVTKRVLDALRLCRLPPDFRITVVMGRDAPWLESVQRRAADMPWTCKVRVDVSDMAHLMTESDLSIGAAGGTSWERCCVGLPSMLLVLADNQRRGAQALVGAGAAVLLSDGPDLADQLSEHLAALLKGDALSTMSNAARAVTDGLGVERVLPYLLEPSRA
ncbi:MAG: UDP-2,4-diacetamido-2,4,6-trideoxy-beta-L-altropyranose hydrolase [Methylibium sp.]|uniref:UDP-2,4-diacetamido-2,4, 6-trideoxy-beta-L-altropyranose hydrolase n=1 Tax=Methylibium sp. TaxID=2067992 RepID=UPI0017D855CA|nr:UDP-2,4-diacetamido-2,4,6-trideoxy-beta-L-altropyranose hydrolase [Methylibium sp.]MBA3596122.1 UDP-2,4-diacetamido-2,4,6-trideoxy-beta-L-altropyranose hydrolase [Methylibium sp.]